MSTRSQAKGVACSHCRGESKKDERLCPNHLKKLQTSWYKKLENEGFEDIEQDEDNLKLWSIEFFRTRYNKSLYEAKEEYYRLAGSFLYEYSFKDATDKFIWKLHAQAISTRDIEEKLKATPHKHIKKDAINDIVRKLAKEMIKKCSPKPT